MKKSLFMSLWLFFITNIFATDHVVDLVVAYRTVDFAGEPVKAITANNQIPAPTLHFKEGDNVTINVHNQLDEETAIHWHGIILPWQMDGVLGISQRGISPGGVFNYKFTLHQSGTYWYHAHAGLQEQQGLYGAFLIDPQQNPNYQYTKDHVIVLSDWSNTHPDQILANLKKEGDYYSPYFPIQPSLVKFIQDYKNSDADERKKLIEDYKMMQEMRMSIYDLSDIAYDSFLLNGKPKANPWTALVKIGDVVRLRFIGAGGSTIFHVKIPGTTMKMVHVNGNDVKPYSISDFTIAPGETFDVLVSIKKDEPYIIYAESTDTVGAAYGALITSSTQSVNYDGITRFPEPKPVTREMMSFMMGDMKHGSLPLLNMPHPMANHKMGPGSMLHEMPMPHEDHKNKAKRSKDHQPMTSSMKMDKTMPMNHVLPMQTDKAQGTSAATNKKSADGMIDMDHSAHSMKKNTSASHTMPMVNGMNNDMPMDHAMPQTEKPQSKASNTNQKSIDDMEGDIGHSANSTPMNSARKMDHDNMPMDHSLPMSDKDKKTTKFSATKESPDNMNMTKTKNSASHAMHLGSTMKMDHSMSMDHSMNMSMPTEPTIIGDEILLSDSSYKTSFGTKYENLIAAVKTNDPNKPVAGVINMELFGYMERFIWFINGVPEHDAKPIILEPGKRYRMIFTNTSMMHHPMHIHGHWFILRKGHDAYDPLLHTIDVAPGATITADIDTDASGQWLFHCHMLYHMMSGMSRTFQYSTLLAITKNEAASQNTTEQTPYYNRPIVRVDEIMPVDHHLIQHPMAHSVGLWLATFLDIGADPFTNSQRINYKGLYGRDYNKLELLIEDAEIKKGKVENADLDIFYWRLLNQFWAVKGGINYVYRPAKTPYWQPGIGLEGLMPYFMDTNIRGYFYRGSAKLDIELSRDTQITNNFFIRLGARSILASKTVKQAVIGSGLNQMRYSFRPYYRLMPGLNIFAEYEHEQAYGTFETIQNNSGESTTENTLTFGLSMLF